MRELKEILKTNNFRFNKNLGQNFISDGNLLNAIVADSGVTAEDTVVEIGTGAGTLTRALSTVAKKVFSFEVDQNLRPVLNETLAGVENVEVIFGDVLKLSDDEIARICGREFKVVANIPYYITTSLIMRFLESSLGVKSITVMIQKEVADRLVAKENTAEYGAITMSVKLRGEAQIVRTVNRNMFYPAPNVDSSVIRIDLIPDKYKGEDIAQLTKLIRCAFGMRRKTFANNLVKDFNISKIEAERIITEAGFDVRIRGESFTIEDLIRIASKMKK